MNTLCIIDKYGRNSKTGMLKSNSRLLKKNKYELINELFDLMIERRNKVGDWELIKFTREHPECVSWEHPDKEIVPLLYACHMKSRWLVRHFLQLDPTKVHETDKSGRDASLIARMRGDSCMGAYVLGVKHGEIDVYKNPLGLENPLKGVPRGPKHMLARNRRLNEVLAEQAKVREEQEKNKNDNVVHVSPLPSINNNLG